MGPPLIDDKWIYGSDPDQIFATIMQGRPNGMPSFRGKIPDYQVWQLAAYVRSLGGLAQDRRRPRPRRPHEDQAAGELAAAADAEQLVGAPVRGDALMRRGYEPILRRAYSASAVSVGAPSLLGAADGTPDRHWAMDPAGPQRRAHLHLWWIFFWVCAVIFVLVVAFTLVAASSGRAGGARPAELESPELTPDARRETPADERRLRRGARIGGPPVRADGRRLGDRPLAPLDGSKDPDPLIVKVIGHQWWWELQYHDPEHPGRAIGHRGQRDPHPDRPAGQVRAELGGRHPQLLDARASPARRTSIPGHPTSTWLQADRPGVYDGQCAEFCGYQHAHMRLRLSRRTHRAVPRVDRRPAAVRPRSVQRLAAPRAAGVPALDLLDVPHDPGHAGRRRVGPDLTHVGSRTTLAAGTLPNTVGHLAGWIVDPQKIKPGVRMPQNNLSPDDLRACWSTWRA